MRNNDRKDLLRLERSARERLTQELRRREMYSMEAQRLSHSGSFGWSVPSGELRWSDETFRIFGYERSILPTRERVLERVHPEDRELSLGVLTEAIQASRDFDMVHRLLMPDGRVKTVHVAGHAVQDESGELEFVGAVMDVTDAKAAEEALRQSEQQWRNVFENNPTMYFMVDAAGLILAANLYGAQQLGYAPDELIGKPVLRLFLDADRNAAQENLDRCRAQPVQSMSWEIRQVRRAGDAIWVRVTARAVYRVYGSTDGPVVLMASEDITEVKQTRELLLHSREEEQRRLARDLHDSTAQSLSALRIDLAVLAESNDHLDARGQAALSSAIAEADHCLDEIRTVAHLLHPPEIGRMGLVRALVGFVEGFVQRSGIHVAFNIPPDFQPLPPETEETLFRIVQEALTNILKHSRSSNAAVDLIRGERSLTLEIRDAGRGIENAILGQAAPMGLGISSMRERVRQVGGNLEIQSGDSGTVVKIAIPVEAHRHG